MVHFLQNLHSIGPPASQLTVPEEQTLGLNVPMDETANGGPERLLLVRACGKSQDLRIQIPRMRETRTYPD